MCMDCVDKASLMTEPHPKTERKGRVRRGSVASLRNKTQRKYSTDRNDQVILQKRSHKKTTQIRALKQ